MPFPREHAARLQNPAKFSDAKGSWSRTSGGTIYGSKKVPGSIDIIWGKLKGRDKPTDNPIPQALRFPISAWTASKAKAWLKKNNIKYIKFEKATETKKDTKKEHTEEEILKEIKKEIKDDKEIIEKNFFIPIRKLNDKRQLVYGVVLEPEKTDAQNEVISEEEIEKCAHDFLKSYNVQKKMGFMHKVFNRKLDLVESYIAPIDFELNGDKIRKGSWVAVTHVVDKTIWKLVEEGKIGGYSISGKARLIRT